MATGIFHIVKVDGRTDGQNCVLAHNKQVAQLSQRDRAAG